MKLTDFRIEPIRDFLNPKTESFLDFKIYVTTEDVPDEVEMEIHFSLKSDNNVFFKTGEGIQEGNKRIILKRTIFEMSGPLKPEITISVEFRNGCKRDVTHGFLLTGYTLWPSGKKKSLYQRIYFSPPRSKSL